MQSRVVIYLSILFSLTLTGLLYEHFVLIPELRKNINSIMIDTVFSSKLITDTIYIKQKVGKPSYVNREIKDKDTMFVFGFTYADKYIAANCTTYYGKNDSSFYKFNYLMYPDTIRSVVHIRNNRYVESMNINGLEYMGQVQIDHLTDIVKTENKPWWNNIWVGYLAGTAMTIAIYQTVRGK
jgi:hypothetical protein